jgi:hypothetical protein
MRTFESIELYFTVNETFERRKLLNRRRDVNNDKDRAGTRTEAEAFKE